MNVINPSNTLHAINIIPRVYISTGVIWLRNELRDKETTININPLINGSYLTLAFNLSVKEGESYEFEFRKIDGAIMYRGKIYCTSQTDLQNYSL